MAGWGALIGLGQGLQDTAQIWNEHKKGELAERLGKEREQRQADRDLAKEQRLAAAERAKVDRNATSVDIDPVTGTYKRTLRNSWYEPLGTAEVGQLEAESIRTQQEAEQAQLRTRSLDAQLKELNLGRLPEKWGQEDAMHDERLQSERALQAQRYASAGASNRRGLESAVTDQGRNSATDAQTLVSAYPELVKEYTTAPRDGQAKLSRDQVEELAHSVIRRSAEREESPAQVAARFREALRIMAARNSKPTPEGTSRPRSGILPPPSK